jgi:hypothetical protein
VDPDDLRHGALRVPQSRAVVSLAVLRLSQIIGCEVETVLRTQVYAQRPTVLTLERLQGLALESMGGAPVIRFAYEERIDADPAAVFAVMTDISRFDQWLGMDGRPKDSGPVRVGSGFDSTSRLGPLPMAGR